MKAAAIIVAAGSGTRLGLSTPKAFITLGGRTMLSYSLTAIAGVAAFAEAIIAVPLGMEKRARAEVNAAGLVIPVKITPGGVERQDSVRIALALISVEAEIVAVHDGARPFARPELFVACIGAAARGDGAIAAKPLPDTLKRVDGATVTGTIPRAGLWQAETPQAFRRDVLVKAHRRAAENHVSATDDAELVEKLGYRVEVVDSSAFGTTNLKITTPADLEIAQMIAGGTIRTA